MTNNELGIKNVHNYVFQHYGLKKRFQQMRVPIKY